MDVPANFSDMDLAVFSNGVTATLLQITHVSTSSSHLQHNPGESDYNPPAAFKNFPSGGGYGIGSRMYNFGQARWVTYTIDSTSEPGHPKLVADLHDGEDEQIIADNIENMQFFYFMDGSVPDTDNPSVDDLDKIRAVRISIVGRTDQPDPDSVAFTPPALEDYAPAAGTVEDGYRRRVLTTVIQIRNMGQV